MKRKLSIISIFCLLLFASCSTTHSVRHRPVKKKRGCDCPSWSHNIPKTNSVVYVA